MNKVIKNNFLAFWQKSYFFDKKVSCASIWELLIEKILSYNIDQRAAAVAYNFTLAVFPTILFLFTLIPYVPIPNLEYTIMNGMRGFMPLPLYEFAASTIYDIISRKSGGILSFGFILALITAINGMGSLIIAFNMANRTAEKRSFLKTKLVSLGLTLLLSVVIFMSVLVIFVGGVVLNFMGDNLHHHDKITFYLLYIMRYVVMFGTFWAVISMIYRFAPAFRHGWRLFNIGSFVASCLIIMITYGFSYYLSNFYSYNKLYGSIGTIIALIIWFYLIALMLILGFELNVSIWRAKHAK